MSSMLHNTANQEPTQATTIFSQDQGLSLRLEKVPTSRAVTKKANPQIDIARAVWRLSLAAPYICKYRNSAATKMTALTRKARTYEFDKVMADYFD